MTEQTAELGKRWKALSEKQQEKYKKQSAKLKEESYVLLFVLMYTLSSQQIPVLRQSKSVLIVFHELHSACICVVIVMMTGHT